jgi:DNA polymerase I
MGDSIDNIKGVPGIGEKGARDLIATYGSLDACSRTPARCRRRSTARRCSRTPTTRGTAASCCDPHRRAVAFDLEALRYRGASRERCFELFSRSGSAR